jgi:hypothetical protein
MKAVLLLVALSAPLWASQAPAMIEAATEGPCSPNVVANEDTVVITSNGVVDPKQIAKVTDILNAVYRRQGEGSEKLDKILDFLKRYVAETERVARDVDELRERMGPRRLSPEQKSRLQEGLSYCPKMRLVIEVSAGDGEAQQYGQDFVAVFQNAGWKPYLSKVIYSQIHTGARVMVDNNIASYGDAPFPVICVFGTLSSLGLASPTLIRHPRESRETVRLQIGARE